MNSIHGRLSNIIATIDFNFLYKGFHSCDFALYNQEYVYFNQRIEKFDERFIGNTTINYNGENIAIWNLEFGIEDDQIFASKIIHEMFHTYQMNQKEIRFPNEFLGLHYNYDKHNLSWKYNETMFLVDAYTNKSMDSFKKFISSRKDRELQFKNETEYEYKIETIEGMARFVELKALAQLNIEKYQKEMCNMINNISIPDNYIPIRTICYNIGALILITAEQFGIAIDHKIGLEQCPIFHIVSADIKKHCSYELKSINTIFVNQYIKKMENVITEILNNPHEIIPCDALTGLDPMNTFKRREYYIFQHFVRIKYKEIETNIFGETLGKIDELGNVTQIYKSLP